jgi:hypothetical protein
MINPFQEQAKIHKKEAQKWSTISKIVGITLFVIIILILM